MKKPYTLLNKAEPYLWILPSIILMCIFIIIPIGFVFRMSMSQVTYLYKLAFYNSKQGVIAVQQEVLLGGDAAQLLADLQAEIAG